MERTHGMMFWVVHSDCVRTLFMTGVDIVMQGNHVGCKAQATC